ncbi:hypothetical protein CASFOL_018320 [Castilleja foliolosa]|uniref:Uncharacterized protein n=1 Tax=Castilleja foliolosa TaxID=1961234 RepID=A0ABD3D7C9_9LAMI
MGHSHQSGSNPVARSSPPSSLCQFATKSLSILGKYAGHKATILKRFDDGTRDRAYGHCLVAGVAKYPSKVIRKDSAKKQAKKSRVKAFIKGSAEGNINLAKESDEKSDNFSPPPEPKAGESSEIVTDDSPINHQNRAQGLILNIPKPAIDGSIDDFVTTNMPPSPIPTPKRWVDEVIPDAPWVINQEFLDKHDID